MDFMYAMVLLYPISIVSTENLHTKKQYFKIYSFIVKRKLELLEFRSWWFFFLFVRI